MVSNSCQLHDNYSEIIHTLWSLDAQQFFTGCMPAHVVDRRRTIIQPVSKRSDLIERSSLGNFFKCTVDITDGLLRRYNSFSIQLNDILKYTMCSGVRGTQVQRGGRFFNASFRKPDIWFCYS